MFFFYSTIIATNQEFATTTLVALRLRGVLQEIVLCSILLLALRLENECTRDHWNKLKSLTKKFQKSFFSSHVGKSVDELWSSFRDTLNTYVNICITTKLIRDKMSLPWITQEIKRLIRKRGRLNSSFEKTRDKKKKKRKKKKQNQGCLSGIS